MQNLMVTCWFRMDFFCCCLGIELAVRLFMLEGIFNYLLHILELFALQKFVYTTVSDRAITETIANSFSNNYAYA